MIKYKKQQNFENINLVLLEYLIQHQLNQMPAID